MARMIRNTEQVKIDSNLLKYLKYGEDIKHIPSYTNYFATNTGRIFSGKKKIEYETLKGEKYYAVIWKELRPRLVNGYWAVNVMDNEGKKKTEYVHVLIFKTFSSEFLDRNVLKIVHRDGDKLNNNINNLALNFRKKNRLSRT